MIGLACQCQPEVVPRGVRSIDRGGCLQLLRGGGVALLGKSHDTALAETAVEHTHLHNEDVFL